MSTVRLHDKGFDEIQKEDFKIAEREKNSSSAEEYEKEESTRHHQNHGLGQF